MDPPQQRYWQDRGGQGDDYSAHQNDRQNAQARSDRGVKIRMADPDRHSDTDGKTKRSADRAQDGGFGGEETLAASFPKRPAPSSGQSRGGGPKPIPSKWRARTPRR